MNACEPADVLIALRQERRISLPAKQGGALGIPIPRLLLRAVGIDPTFRRIVALIPMVVTLPCDHLLPVGFINTLVLPRLAKKASCAS